MKWHSELPDGRNVMIRRISEHWVVVCGQSRAHSKNLDVALAQAIRGDTEVIRQMDEIHYAAWVRDVADRLAS
jgi:hypothetical protein